ncbi:zinc metallopeptidase [Metabacillus endolithicus]|uniref:Zinc metallopeptidase n=1 Tax=Metabacillus endolithicus TaxID=1535204 RepID=A0ABW5BZH9_9BACI|nr:zinc metallopeptidase [Metabacillus endolithicus]UPG65526.1 zinc metallopeptidase [Metabacillus endolithicus]
MAPYVIVTILIISLIVNHLAVNAFLALYKQTAKFKFSGDEIAAKILDYYDEPMVGIKKSNKLHRNIYHPKYHHIELGPEVFGNRTVYSVAVAAHEAMHAVQYNYARLYKIYTQKISVFIFLPLLILSFFYNYSWIHILLVGIYVSLVLFKVYSETLDEIEMNKLAYKYLKKVCSREEMLEVKKIYRSNALTYITNTPFIFN